MKIMKKFIIFFAVLLAGISLYAQSASVVTDILSSEEITYGQAAYISAVSQKLINDDASLDDAVTALKNAGQISENATGSDAINIQELSGIYTKMFNVDGGLFYRLTKGAPRYAFKYLKTEGLISASTDPSKVLTGSEALSLFTKCNMRYGEPQFTDEL